MNEIKIGALRYIGKLLLQRILGAAAFFIAAKTWKIPRGIIYFAVYMITTIISAIIMYRHDPELLNVRRKAGVGTKNWDKILLLMYVLLAFYGIYVVAGLDSRYQESATSPILFWGGMFIMIMTCFLAIWPVMENRNFESSARIQKDRGQSVCTTGPYAIVRHPGYSIIVLWAISMPMMFGRLTGIVAIVIGVIIVIRTYLEDTMLKRELPGYVEYTQKVRYRLIPYIW